MRYRPEIDGLRAIAVIPVILFHAGFSWCSGGFVGVDVFFVISGYLITNIISSELEENRFSIIEFYERRARRILPALFLVLLSCLPFAWLWLLPQDMKSFSQSLVTVPAFASNILFFLTTDYFDTAAELKPLLHTWSLAVEEQYYLFFPLALMLSWRMGKIRALGFLTAMAVFSLGAAHWASISNPAAAFYLLPARGWELLMGSFLAFYLRNEKISSQRKITGEVGGWVGLVLLMYSIIFFNQLIPFPSLYTLVPTLGAALIIAFATQDTSIGKLLSNKNLVGVGLISYSAYLWHQPLFAFARHRSMNEPGSWLLGSLTIVAMVLAYLSWKYIEAPFRNKKKFARDKIFIYGFGGSICFILLGLAGHITNGFQGRMPSVVAEISKSNIEVFEKQVKDCWTKFEKMPAIASACKLGSDKIKASFVLVGDSHAAALMPEIDLAAKKSGIAGLNYTYRSCPPLSGVNTASMTIGDKTCSALRADFFANLSGKEIPDIVIINARWALLMERTRFNNNEGGREGGGEWLWDIDAKDGNYRQLMAYHISASINSILQSGRRVILIYPVPEMGWQVPARLSKAFLFKGEVTDQEGSIPYADYILRSKHAIDVLDGIGVNPNLIRIRPDEMLCNSYLQNRCAAHLHGKPFYFDNNHLSNTGASLVVGEIMRHLGK